MGDHLGWIHCRALFESALQAYEDTTGAGLAEHPLAVDLQNCRSIEFATVLLQLQAGAFSDFRGNDKIRKLIESIVSILFTLSGQGILGTSIGLVSQIDSAE
jgi:hypothetical protein